MNPTRPSLPARAPEGGARPGMQMSSLLYSLLCLLLAPREANSYFLGSLAGEGPALRPHRATDHLQPWGAELRFQEAAGCAGVLPALHHL